MRGTGYRPLIGPAALAAAGFLVHGLAPDIAARLHLAPEGLGAAALRVLSGIGAWLALAWTAARLAELGMRRAAQVSRRAAPYPRLLSDLLRAALFAAALVAILLFVLEQPAIGLITTSSVVIAVVGFALRNIISDVFSGIALGIDHPYRIGDWIETAEGCTGQVVEISWRATRLRARSGVALVVPNGLIAAHRLINYGAGEQPYRVALQVPLDPALPVRRAKRVLLAGALDAERGIPGLAPDVLVQEFAEGAAVYLVRFHVPDHGREIACRDAVGAAVLRALRHAGIGLARPARELRLVRGGAPSADGAAARREALLAQIDLFRPFDADERAELAARMEERHVPKGDLVVRQGEVGRSLYVLAEGALEVRIARPGRDGEDDDNDGGAATDRLVPGDLFGEMALLTGQPRGATVTAATDAVVYEMRKEHLDPVLQRRPEIADGLAAIMAARQARNAARRSGAAPGRAPGAEAPTREDLLGRLRAFFHL